jgi:hypothetical protein
MKFNFVFFGQSVLRYEVPIDIFNEINSSYENNYGNLAKANKQLIGKIMDERSLYYDGDDTSKMHKHNYLSPNVYEWFMSVYKHYLDWNKVIKYQLHLNSIWVNEMKSNEYNPIHIHQGNLATGLTSVMILKVPSHYGVEYSAEDKPQNGRLQILGSAAGQFANINYTPPMQVRDFYVFPYDMRHCVYPFNGTDETRRTLAANCDVLYNPLENRKG